MISRVAQYFEPKRDSCGSRLTYSGLTWDQVGPLLAPYGHLQASGRAQLRNSHIANTNAFHLFDPPTRYGPRMKTRFRCTADIQRATRLGIGGNSGDFIHHSGHGRLPQRHQQQTPGSSKQPCFSVVAYAAGRRTMPCKKLEWAWSAAERAPSSVLSIAWFCRVNFPKPKTSMIGFQATALPHSMNAFCLSFRLC